MSAVFHAVETPKALLTAAEHFVLFWMLLQGTAERVRQLEAELQAAAQAKLAAERQAGEAARAAEAARAESGRHAAKATELEAKAKVSKALSFCCASAVVPV
eukprot:SAG22_NODE_246_length_13948_cov_12.055744_8_plen_102_part_00